MTLFELSAIILIILYIKHTNVKHTLISINHPLYICSTFVFFVCSDLTNYRKDILKWVRLYKNDLFIQFLCVISIIVLSVIPAFGSRSIKLKAMNKQALSECEAISFVLLIDKV